MRFSTYSSPSLPSISFSKRLQQLALSIGLVLLFSQGAFAQDHDHNHDHPDEKCASDWYQEQLMQDSAYAAEHEQQQQRVSKYLAENKTSEKRMMCENTLLIPVAVHFQNTGIPIDCAIDMSLSQVQTLNEDFGAYNDDIGDWVAAQAAHFPGIENKVSCIQFCLATQEHPAGFGLVDGDYAVTLDQTMGDNDPAWSGYLNFWVRDLGGGLLGYSPLGGTGNGDGATCNVTAFGSVSCGGNNITGAFNLGRTMTHEIGHYLNLEHPWGGGGCASTDDIADTPVTDGPTFGCPNTPPNTCGQDVLWPTYMEYCDDACLFMFSEDQVDRMEAHVNTNLQNMLNTSTTVCTEAACLGFELASATSTPESCAGFDGTISVTLAEGNAPFVYSSNGGVSFQSASTFVGLTAGIYDIVVRDNEACEVMTTIEVIEQAPPIQVLSLENSFCGFPNGSMIIDVDLDPLVFEYSIDGGLSWQNDGIFEGLPPGSYDVRARTLGCEGQTFITVGDENDLDATVRVSPVNCYAFDNGEVSTTVGGGEPPYNFTLDFGQDENLSGNFDLLSLGQHTVTIEDQRGCVTDIEFEVERSFGPFDDDCPCSMYVPTAFTPDGDGINEYYFVVPSCPVAEYEFTIYDRWGEILFQTTDPTKPWLGGAEGQQYYVSPGAYQYRLIYKWGDEEGQQAQSNIETGVIAIVR